uniref:Serine peptidase inhibitor Kazal type 4 n=2 Tax=Ursus TaxID=9639 RepID=A0A452THW9_URSMA
HMNGLWLVRLRRDHLSLGPRTPICEHMEESPVCSQTSNLVCGTDGVTYDNECQICLIRLKTKQDIQIFKDGKC